MLAAAGCVLGLVIGVWCTRLLVLVSSGTLTFAGAPEVQLDLRVTSFAVVVSTMAALRVRPASGVAVVARRSAARAEGSGRGATKHAHARLRDALVVGQMALAVVLLVGAGLLLRTFSNLLRVDLGFRPAHVITMSLFLGGHDTNGRASLIARMLERVSSLPGIEAAGTIQFVPIAGTAPAAPVSVSTIAPTPGRCVTSRSPLHSSTARYFAAMGIPVIEGRPFGPEDRLGSRRRRAREPGVRPALHSRRPRARPPPAGAVVVPGADRDRRRGRRRPPQRAHRRARAHRLPLTRAGAGLHHQHRGANQRRARRCRPARFAARSRTSIPRNPSAP